MKRIITMEMVREYTVYLREEEKSRATIEKYARDLKKLIKYAAGREITKSLMVDYKEMLYETGEYKVSSINSYLVAANRFFEYMEWYGLKVKTYRVQREPFCPEDKCLTKGEYKRLLKEAGKEGRLRLYLILETLASTGMRVSELKFLTTEAVRTGMAQIYNKGKVRTVLLTKQLKKQLLCYMGQEHILSGPVFCTKTGRAVDRSNVWREMKELCGKAHVRMEKVFPHNLRHLFARCFYKEGKDIAKLADILGHESIETTRGYVRETSEECRKQLEALGLVGNFYGTT